MFFVDANVVVYASTDSRYRAGSLAVLEAVADGAAGTTSVAVLEEVWHLERSGRLPGIDGITAEALDVFWPPVPVTGPVLRAAMQLDVTGLGADDLVHVATCYGLGIRDVVTADRAFDAAPGLRRVDPLDGAAVRALLAG
ncbi:MAG TPA: type II toxin-antitoxin system VapC family toxin [Acidimicrobiales bacterium]